VEANRDFKLRFVEDQPGEAVSPELLTVPRSSSFVRIDSLIEDLVRVSRQHPSGIFTGAEALDSLTRGSHGQCNKLVHAISSAIGKLVSAKALSIYSYYAPIG
jgi:hypothetical protein